MSSTYTPTNPVELPLYTTGGELRILDPIPAAEAWNTPQRKVVKITGRLDNFKVGPLFVRDVSVVATGYEPIAGLGEPAGEMLPMPQLDALDYHIAISGEVGHEPGEDKDSAVGFYVSQGIVMEFLMPADGKFEKTKDERVDNVRLFVRTDAIHISISGHKSDPCKDNGDILMGSVLFGETNEEVMVRARYLCAAPEGDEIVRFTVVGSATRLAVGGVALTGVLIDFEGSGPKGDLYAADDKESSSAAAVSAAAALGGGGGSFTAGLSWAGSVEGTLSLEDLASMPWLNSASVTAAANMTLSSDGVFNVENYRVHTAIDIAVGGGGGLRVRAEATVEMPCTHSASFELSELSLGILNDNAGGDGGTTVSGTIIAYCNNNGDANAAELAGNPNSQLVRATTTTGQSSSNAVALGRGFKLDKAVVDIEAHISTLQISSSFALHDVSASVHVFETRDGGAKEDSIMWAKGHVSGTIDIGGGDFVATVNVAFVTPHGGEGMELDVGFRVAIKTGVIEGSAHGSVSAIGAAACEGNMATLDEIDVQINVGAAPFKFAGSGAVVCPDDNGEVEYLLNVTGFEWAPHKLISVTDVSVELSLKTPSNAIMGRASGTVSLSSIGAATGFDADAAGMQLEVSVDVAFHRAACDKPGLPACKMRIDNINVAVEFSFATGSLAKKKKGSDDEEVASGTGFALDGKVEFGFPRKSGVPIKGSGSLSIQIGSMSIKDFRIGVQHVVRIAAGL